MSLYEDDCCRVDFIAEGEISFLLRFNLKTFPEKRRLYDILNRVSARLTGGFVEEAFIEEKRYDLTLLERFDFVCVRKTFRVCIPKGQAWMC